MDYTSCTVLIPAFNEEKSVAKVIEACRDMNLPVVVVDDGSSDLTGEVARAAGAEVIRLQSNQGKGSALFAGLAKVHTPYVLLLDADLLGLSQEHLYALLEPVLSGRLEMSIGVFREGGFMTDFGNRAAPHLSGQRVCRSEWLLSVPHLATERWPEPAITRHLRQTGIRWAYVILTGLRQIMKEKKRGFWVGIAHRANMYYHILRYWINAARRSGL